MSRPHRTAASAAQIRIVQSTNRHDAEYYLQLALQESLLTAAEGQHIPTEGRRGTAAETQQQQTKDRLRRPPKKKRKRIKQEEQENTKEDSEEENEEKTVKEAASTRLTSSAINPLISSPPSRFNRTYNHNADEPLRQVLQASLLTARDERCKNRSITPTTSDRSGRSTPSTPQPRKIKATEKNVSHDEERIANEVEDKDEEEKQEQDQLEAAVSINSKSSSAAAAPAEGSASVILPPPAVPISSLSSRMDTIMTSPPPFPTHHAQADDPQHPASKTNLDHAQIFSFQSPKMPTPIVPTATEPIAFIDEQSVVTGRQAQESEDEKLAHEMARVDHEISEGGTYSRRRRANITSILCRSYENEEIQILLFPIRDANSASSLTVSACSSVSSARNSAGSSQEIRPSPSNLLDMMNLFKRTFSHISAQSLDGLAAILLLDEADFRLKRSNSRNRLKATVHEPFDTMVCACVFDVKPYMLRGVEQHIVRLSYCATEERFAGRGFAKLLISHVKTRAAHLAAVTNKDATLIVLSLAHTIPWWCSKSLGFMSGGAASQVLSDLNMADTTLCTQSVPIGSYTSLCTIREKIILEVRNKLKLPLEQLKVFPRWATKTKVKMKESEEEEKEKEKEKEKRKGKEKQTAPNSTNSTIPSPSPLPSASLPTIFEFIPGPSLPETSVPYLTSAKEWKVFWTILEILMTQIKQIQSIPTTTRSRQHNQHAQFRPLILPDTPPAQHIHLSAHDFHPDEILLAAIQTHTLPDQVREFSIERVQLISPCEQNQYAWNVKMLDRVAASTPASMPTSFLRKKRHCGEAEQPNTVNVMICAIVPICYLYKPSMKSCRFHLTPDCCRYQGTTET